MKWVFLFAVVVANAVAVFFALAPGLVTYAEVPPAGITCSLCTAPEVQTALTAAAKYGRDGILRQLESAAPWVLGLAVFNIGAFSLALFIRQRSNKLSEPTP